jgi:hypothetical protein
MKATDFITESARKSRPDGELPDHYDRANPGAITGIDMDRYYDMYRAGMLMGRAPATFEPVDAASWLNNRAYFGAYTDIDREKITQAFRELGIRGTNLTSPGSHEPKDTNKQSPVVAFRGYEK